MTIEELRTAMFDLISRNQKTEDKELLTQINDLGPRILNVLDEYLEMKKHSVPLPVSIGDIVYRINPCTKENPIIPMGVVSITLKGATNPFKKFTCREYGYNGEYTYRFSEIGRNVFLTRESALEAIAEYLIYNSPGSEFIIGEVEKDSQSAELLSRL